MTEHSAAALCVYEKTVKLTMKKFAKMIIGILCCALMLAACQASKPAKGSLSQVRPTLPQPGTEPVQTDATEPAPVETTLPAQASPELDALREEMGEDCLFAAAYLGVVETPEADLRGWIAENQPELTAKLPFVTQIPQERILGTEGELYLVIPKDPQAEVSVEFMAAGEGDPIRYQAQTGDPILVFCNAPGDAETLVWILSAKGEVYWQPQCAEDGRRQILPREGWDISVYEEIGEDPIRDRLEKGWVLPDQQMLHNSDWTADATRDGKPVWLFMYLRANGTADISWVWQGSTETQEVYTGTWRLYYEGRAFLALELTDPMGTTIQETLPVVISPDGMNLLLGEGAGHLPADPLENGATAEFERSIG